MAFRKTTLFTMSLWFRGGERLERGRGIGGILRLIKSEKILKNSFFKILPDLKLMSQVEKANHRLYSMLSKSNTDVKLERVKCMFYQNEIIVWGRMTLNFRPDLNLNRK